MMLKNIPFAVGFIAFFHVVGMIFSPFLQSFTLLLLGGIALFYFFVETKDKKVFWNVYQRKLDYWFLGFIFLEVALGVFVAVDWDYMLERIRLRVPFIGLPFAFFLLPSLSLVWYKNWWLAVIIVIDIVAVGVIVYYFNHQQDIQLLLEQGKAIPTPANHIRYALLQVVAFCVSVYWGWLHRGHSNQPRITLFFKASSIFLFVFIHFLAVRSGLFSLYLIIVSMGVPYLFKKRAYVTLLLFLTGVILLPFLGMKLIPSLKKKIEYVYYDVDMFLKGKATDQLSDASRLISWKLGLELFVDNPTFGVGAGNIRIKMNELYKRDYPAFEKKLTPHNQFIMVLASSGLIGLFLFCIGFFVPLFYGKNYKDPFVLAIYLSFFASFLVEATFENAMGVAIFLFFTIVHLNQNKLSND
jgi:O-antigen ligase